MTAVDYAICGVILWLTFWAVIAIDEIAHGRRVR